MSIEMPAALANATAQTAIESQSASTAWLETTLTVLFTATAVLFVSFLAVVTGIV